MLPTLCVSPCVWFKGTPKFETDVRGGMVGDGKPSDSGGAGQGLRNSNLMLQEMGVSKNWGFPKMVGVIMENPIKMNDLGAPPL